MCAFPPCSGDKFSLQLVNKRQLKGRGWRPKYSSQKEDSIVGKRIAVMYTYMGEKYNEKGQSRA